MFFSLHPPKISEFNIYLLFDLYKRNSYNRSSLLVSSSFCTGEAGTHTSVCRNFSAVEDATGAQGVEDIEVFRDHSRY